MNTYNGQHQFTTTSLKVAIDRDPGLEIRTMSPECLPCPSLQLSQRHTIPPAVQYHSNGLEMMIDTGVAMLPLLNAVGFVRNHDANSSCKLSKRDSRLLPRTFGCGQYVIVGDGRTTSVHHPCNGSTNLKLGHGEAHPLLQVNSRA